MGYDGRSRDRYRWVVTGLTGALAAGTLVGTGALAGHAARAQRVKEAAEQQRRDAELAAWRDEQAAYEAELVASRRAEPVVVVRRRPTRTRVTTRYVTGGSPSTVGLRATTSSGGRPTHGTPSAGGGRTGGSGGGGAGSAPPPPPPPPPPTSSGS